MKLSIPKFSSLREMLLPADIIDVLRHRDFKLLFAATVAANLGDAFYFVALPWLVLAYGGSATAVGLTGAAAMLPYVLLGPLAGVISDRVNRKNLMIASDLARALIIAVLVAAGWLGLLQSWHFAITAFLLTAAGLFIFPARGALIPSLVPKQELVAANAAMSTGFQMMNIAGKAAGGFLILAVGPIPAMGLCGATYVVSSILISRMAPPPRAGPVRTAGPILPGASIVVDLLDSAKFIARHPLIRALALTGLALNALHFPAMTMLLPLHLSGSVRAGPEVFGLFLAIESAGVLVAMPMAPRFSRWVGEGRLGALTIAVLGGLVVLLAMATHVWQVLALAMLMGVVTAGGVPMGSLVQAETPDAYRGRVLANLAAASSAFIPLTMALGGNLVDLHGSRPLYAATGIVVAICGLALLATRRVREARIVTSQRAE